MVEKVTVELPEELIRQVRVAASRTRRSVDEVLADWIRIAGGEAALEWLSDEELLAVCDAQPDQEFEETLSGLLERNQDGALDAGERLRLDELMHTYRAGLVRKAHALKSAVSRGLRPRLS